MPRSDVTGRRSSVGWMWIVAVAVFALDGAVLAMNDQFGAFAAALVAGVPLGFFFGVEVAGGAFGPSFFGTPAAAGVGYNVTGFAFGHDYSLFSVNRFFPVSSCCIKPFFWSCRWVSLWLSKVIS